VLAWGAVVTNHSEDAEIQEQLRKSRSLYQREMAYALLCHTPAEKRGLAARWRKEYPENTYKRLLELARNKDVARVMAKWNVDNWVRTDK
jgi:hypothetical protein